MVILRLFCNMEHTSAHSDTEIKYMYPEIIKHSLNYDFGDVWNENYGDVWNENYAFDNWNLRPKLNPVIWWEFQLITLLQFNIYGTLMICMNHSFVNVLSKFCKSYYDSFVHSSKAI